VNNPFDVESNEPVVKVENNAQSDDTRVAQFREAFADTDFRLLEPVHPEVNYSFEVINADPWTLELNADKWWLGDNGHVENSSLTLNTFSLEEDEVQRETIREEAAMEREELLRIHAAQGLEAAMHKAEDIAIDNDYLNEDRDDPRLFTEGPKDRFFTQCELEAAYGDSLDEPPIDLDAIDLGESSGGYDIWDFDL
jgi:hypothetical protein